MLEQSIRMRIAVMASGHRRRVRRRRSGRACRHAGDRDGLPGEFLNLVRGVYLVDMPVQGRRTVPRWCRTTVRRTPWVYRCWWWRPRWGSAGGRLVLRRFRLRVDVSVRGAGGGRVRTSSPASIGIAFGVRSRTSSRCSPATGTARRRRCRSRPPRYASMGVSIVVTYLASGADTPSAGPAGVARGGEGHVQRAPGDQPGRQFAPAPPPGPVSGGHGVVLDRQEDVRRPVRAPLPPSMAILIPLGPRYAA